MRRSAAAAVAALSIGFLASSSAELSPFVERPVEQEVVLQLLLGGVGPRRLVLRDAFIGYRTEQGLLLPLGEIAAALDFAIAVDPDAGRAEGWFLDEQRRFSLDTRSGEVRVADRIEPLPPGLVERQFAEIYVESELLPRWFPIELELDLARLTVEVRAREPLPIQQRLDRAREHREQSWRTRVQSQYPRLEVPRRMAEVAFLDVSQQLEYDSREGFTARYATLFTGDLLFMDTSLHLAGEDGDALDALRLTLGRRDPERGLLGPLAASEFEFGDVFTPQLPLIAEQQEGRGVLLSSFPLDRPTDFDRTTLRGDLPLGWEAELYRNGVLLDAIPASSDGRYEFRDVPLLFGANRLELVFYGPQGQRRSEMRRVWVGPSMVPPGEQRYRLAFNQQAEDLISVNDDPVPHPERQGSPRLLLEYERGLDRRLSFAAGAASLPLDDGQHVYGSAGLRASLLGSLARFDASVDASGGQALLASVQTELFGLGLSATHEHFRRFVSERAEPEDALRSRSRLRLDGTLRSGSLPPIPFGLSGTLERGESGRLDAELSHRLSLVWGDLRASHVLDVRWLDGADLEGYSRIEGAILLNARLAGLQLRGDLGYDLDPTTELSSLGFTVERPIAKDWGAGLSLRRELRDTPITTIAPGIYGHFRNLSLGIDGSFTDEGDFTVGLTLAFGAARDPRSGTLRIRPRGMASDGAASARVFLDTNQNGRWDAGEDLLEGVRFDRLGDVETDRDGLAFITGLASYRPTALRLSSDGLEDPFWLPLQEGVEIVPRPGKTALVEFAVMPTGEIDGTVYLQRGHETRPASNVRLELRDADGELRRETRTEFDGFYLFDFVPPGRYRVGIAQEPSQPVGLAPLLPSEVEVTGNGAVVSGIDFVIDRSPRPVPAPEAPWLDASRAASEPTEPTDPVPAASVRPFRVQLASYRGPTRARLGWERLRADHAELLAHYRQTLERVRLDSGVVYRLQVGPLESESAAGQLCSLLRARDSDCLVVDPYGGLPAATSP